MSREGFLFPQEVGYLGHCVINLGDSGPTDLPGDSLGDLKQ